MPDGALATRWLIRKIYTRFLQNSITQLRKPPLFSLSLSPPPRVRAQFVSPANAKRIDTAAHIYATALARARARVCAIEPYK